MHDPTAAVCPVAHANLAPVKITPWRWGLAFVGVLFFGLGGIGAVVPGMPTTIFLLIGSFFLTRSCPWLEERMLNTKLLAPYARFVRSREPMSMNARIAAMSMMWLSISISLTVLAFAGKLGVTLGCVIVGLGLLGTVSIAMFRRRRAIA